jgi:predicted lipoprotein with Yx(FWY)xxD motif
MKRITPLILIALAAAALTACGSSSQQAQKSAAASPAKTQTVSLATVSGVGKVLVDSKGFALYSPKQDTAQMIRCTGSCTSIWVPLTVKGTPTADSSLAGKLGTVMRPDGRKQVTFDGKPLYTFVEDSPKTVNGNGASDQFGGRHFNWKVASPGKTAPSSSGGGGGGYNYG